MLLHRNLIYTGITRGKRLLVLVGKRRLWTSRVAQKAALGIAGELDGREPTYIGANSEYCTGVLVRSYLLRGSLWLVLHGFHVNIDLDFLANRRDGGIE